MKPTTTLKLVQRKPRNSLLRLFGRVTVGLLIVCLIISGATLELGRRLPDSGGKIYYTVDNGLQTGRAPVILDRLHSIDYNIPRRFAILSDPVPSPDGQEAAYVVTSSYQSEIHILSFAGGESRAVYSKPEARPFVSTLLDLSWAPSGQYLGFSSNGRLLKLDVASEQVSPVIAEAQGSGFNDTKLAWSSDGQQIAFASSNREARNWQIYLMNSDGSDIRRITRMDVCVFYQATWSPRGNLLIVEGSCENAQTIYLFDADTGSLRSLSTLPLSIWGAAWSPDGSQIAFTAGGNPQSQQIYIINADGSGERRLVDGSSASWSPDGTALLFRSTQGDLFMVRSDGSDLHRLTFTNGKPLLFPLAWSR